MNIDPTLYSELAAEIQSADSPVGIDAKKTHIIIIEKLIRIQEKLDALEKDINALKSQH